MTPLSTITSARSAWPASIWKFGLVSLVAVALATAGAEALPGLDDSGSGAVVASSQAPAVKKPCVATPDPCTSTGGGGGGGQYSNNDAGANDKYSGENPNPPDE